MARQLSGDEQFKRIGISSFSEGKTSLEVIGRSGFNTESAIKTVDVIGDVFIEGDVSIGTTGVVPASTGPGSTTVLAVGIVTANEIYGELKDATGIVTSAYNIAGGDDGQLLVQAGPGITSFFEYGSVNQVLASRGSGNPPQWVGAAPAGAIEGILLFDEGNQVGMGTSYGGLDFRGESISVTGAPQGGIATITATGNFGDEFISGAGITVTGVGTFSGGLDVAGIITAIPGFALTFFGDGSNLTGVNAGFWEKTSAGINTLSNVGIGTTNPLSDLQVGSATSSFSVISDGSTVQVGIGTTDPGIFTLDVRGDANISGDLTVNGNNIPTLALIIALGGF